MWADRGTAPGYRSSAARARGGRARLDRASDVAPSKPGIATATRTASNRFHRSISAASRRCCLRPGSATAHRPSICCGQERTSTIAHRTVPRPWSSLRTADTGRWRSCCSTKGADANAADAGYSALHAAVLLGDVDLAKALLAHRRRSRVPAHEGHAEPVLQQGLRVQRGARRRHAAVAGGPLRRERDDACARRGRRRWTRHVA